MGRFTSRIACFLAAFAAITALAAPNKDWSIVSLGALPSHPAFSVAESINNAGDIAGWSNIFDPTINANRSFAVRWENGAIENLGQGIAFSVNQHGHIAGSIEHIGAAILEDGIWNPISRNGAPFAINKFDAVAGWLLGGQTHAYLYDNGMLLDLGTLAGGSSVGTSLNDRGVVVGYSNSADGNDHAFIYEDGVMRDLGTLNGGFVSRAHDINNHGVVVGEAWDASGNSRPFVYDGMMRQLFVDSGCCIVPHALNDHGAVVGTIDGNHSFLYDDGVLVRLETLPAVQADGWTQLIPNDINDRGWIVGMGRKGPLQSPAQQEWFAFLLKPPHSM